MQSYADRVDTSSITPTPSQLRALTHPARLRMLGILRTEGSTTATALAQRLGRSGRKEGESSEIRIYVEEEAPGHLLGITQIDGSASRTCRAEREAGDYRGLGQALAGSLFKAVLDRDIPVEFEKRARKLVYRLGNA